jgi:hypothetical protein
MRLSGSSYLQIGEQGRVTSASHGQERELACGFNNSLCSLIFLHAGFKGIGAKGRLHLSLHARKDFLRFPL